jgi:hypothetical protein
MKKSSYRQEYATYELSKLEQKQYFVCKSRFSIIKIILIYFNLIIENVVVL